MNPENWPFADPPNVITFTVREIMEGDKPILWVSHDEDDGAWQFHAGGEPDPVDALVICLKNVVAIDPTLLELADLPVGWQASRESASQPWKRIRVPR